MVKYGEMGLKKEATARMQFEAAQEEQNEVEMTMDVFFVGLQGMAVEVSEMEVVARVKNRRSRC